jgi:hypothetical protein
MQRLLIHWGERLLGFLQALRKLLFFRSQALGFLHQRALLDGARNKTQQLFRRIRFRDEVKRALLDRLDRVIE